MMPAMRVSADDTADVIVRMRSAHDDAVPNANATMISNLVALFLITGRKPSTQIGLRQSSMRSVLMSAATSLAMRGLLACGFDLVAPQHVVIADGKGYGMLWPA